MPGHAYGLPAKECKTGGKLQKVKGSTCYGCYALKGCYVFKVVQDAQYKRLKAIRHPLWVRAMAMQINSKKTKFFRWHDSGDIQDLKHLAKIFEVAKRSPDVQHWLPTREAWTAEVSGQSASKFKINFFYADGQSGSGGRLELYHHRGDRSEQSDLPRSKAGQRVQELPGVLG